MAGDRVAAIVRDVLSRKVRAPEIGGPTECLRYQMAFPNRRNGKT